MTETVEIVEVAPRDGFQSIKPWIETAEKIAIVRALHEAGLRRIEIGSFVSASAIPQLADTAQVLAASRELAGLDAQVLIPTERRCAQALEAGATHLAFVLSVSESHNRNNVRQSPEESAAAYRAIVSALPEGVRMRLALATSFDCPFEGRIAPERTLALLETVAEARAGLEIALCDTTGRVTPDQVETLFEAAMRRFPDVRNWVFHGHDTFGMGLANVMSAWRTGVRIFDAAAAGLGGCPFAPGATGNVATEDLAWAFANMGIDTGIDLDRLVAVADRLVALPGAQSGGRVRDALHGHAAAGISSGPGGPGASGRPPSPAPAGSAA